MGGPNKLGIPVLALVLGVSVLLGRAAGIPWKLACMPGVPFERTLLRGLTLLAAFVPGACPPTRRRYCRAG